MHRKSSEALVFYLELKILTALELMLFLNPCCACVYCSPARHDTSCEDGLHCTPVETCEDYGG